MVEGIWGAQRRAQDFWRLGRGVDRVSHIGAKGLGIGGYGILWWARIITSCLNPQPSRRVQVSVFNALVGAFVHCDMTSIGQAPEPYLDHIKPACLGLLISMVSC